jgi:hypothetical protein
MLIEKSEDIVFPCWDVFVQQVASVGRGETDFRINLQTVWFVETFELYQDQQASPVCSRRLWMNSYFSSSFNKFAKRTPASAIRFRASALALVL